ncbi:nitronate monooxygenase [Paenibacillus antri]|uniref:Probable nitronate monooxygenase n=1 Tax=Paenibacillus antri TaxID=2582848 RepID=A0A5R9GIP6_9BACL|nr:nitronate monooxygenase [Paenibacillus antri]TLS52713.1 nitronate monooxygenase [Paenibacillus antri]
MRLPIIVAPMFLVSSPRMVIESCRAGVIGAIPLLNARTPDICAEWLSEIQEALPTETWGVNIICHRGENPRFDDDLALIEAYRPPLVISSLGNPAAIVETVHRYGGKVYADVISEKHARKAAKAGVDGLILVCAGAGGHGGRLHPFAFVHAVKAFYEGTIVLAGAVSTGADIAAARVVGADYVYMGTRFLAADEGSASDAFKEMVMQSSIEDIVYTDAVTGVHANFLLPSLQASNIDIAAPGRGKADMAGMTEHKAWKAIFSAGQGVGAVRERQSVRDIVAQLTREYEEARQRI